MIFSPFSKTKEIQLTIRDRHLIVFQGAVRAITSINLKGRFDILPEHANFISIIKDFIILHKPDGSQQEIKISRGVLKFEDGTAAIYLGVAPETKQETAAK